MTIDEAIAHAREVAKKKYNEGMLCHANPDDGILDKCINCAREHEQLAEWLEELKRYRNTESDYAQGDKDAASEWEEAEDKMELQKVINQLEDLKGHCESMVDKEDPDSPWQADCEALVVANAVLEKRVPMKVINNGHGVYFCPVCHGSVWQIPSESHYCFRCGQKLDWSE